MKKILIPILTAAFLSSILFISCGKMPSGLLGKSGVIERVVGKVEIVRNNQTFAVVAGAKLLQGDVIKTGTDGVVIIVINGVVKTEIQQNTEFKLIDITSKMKTSLLKGNAWTLVEKLEKGKSFSCDGPTAVVGVRGTKFYMFDAGNGMQGICHCEGDSDFLDKVNNKPTLHHGDNMVFMKDGKTIVLTSKELSSIKFIHHHSALNDSIVGPKNDIPMEIQEKVRAIADKKFAELK
jgi:hypothetical protein